MPKHKPPPKTLSRSLFPEEMRVLPLIQALVPGALGSGGAITDEGRGRMLVPVVGIGRSSRRKEEEEAMACGGSGGGVNGRMRGVGRLDFHIFLNILAVQKLQPRSRARTASVSP